MLLLKKHYEKVILAVLLLIFLLLLGFQIMVILRAKDIEIDTVLGVKPPKPGYPRQVDFSKPEFTEKAIFDSEKSHWISDPSKAGKNDVCQAFPIIRCPFGPHLIPVTDYPPNNSKNPGKCSYCGNEIKVLITSLVVTEDDSDGDGIRKIRKTPLWTRIMTDSPIWRSTRRKPIRRIRRTVRAMQRNSIIRRSKTSRSACGFPVSVPTR